MVVKIQIWPEILKKKGKWYLDEKITRPGKYGETENSFSVRAEHAKYYKRIVDIRNALKSENDNETRSDLHNQYKEIVEEMRLFDDLSWQFQNNRQPIEVDLGETGTQMAVAVTLRPENIDPQKTPLIIIPGISSNIEGVGAFPVKLAMESRQAVTIIGHPESWMGRVTPEFSQEVKKSENFEPHTTFFKKAINQIIGGETGFDLCGISAGCVLTGEITSDNEFNQRIGKINLIVPPGFTDMSKISNLLIAAPKMLQESFSKDPRFTTSILDSINESKEQRGLKIDTYKAIRGHLLKKYNWWENPNLHQNRKTKVILSEKDGVTLGGVYGQKLLNQSSFDVSVIKDGVHGTFAKEPERIIEKMDF